MLRRHSDRLKIIRSVFGAVIVLFAIALRAFKLAGNDWLIIGLVLVGAGLVSPTFIVDLVHAWRGKASQSDDHPTVPPAP